jgi:WD40 repeat protein
VILDFSLSSDGSKIAIYTNRGIYIYDAQTLEKTVFQEFANPDYHEHIFAGAVAFNLDGTKIATSSKNTDYSVEIWNLSTGKITGRISDIPNGHYVTEIEFSPTGDSIFIRSTFPFSARCEQAEDSLALYSLNKPSELYPEARLFERYFCDYVPGTFRFTNDGKLFLFLESMGIDYWVFVVNSSTGEIIKRNKYQYDKDGEFYDVSSNGSAFAIHEIADIQYVTTKLIDSRTEDTISTWPYNIRLLNDENHFLARTYTDASWQYWENGTFICSMDGVGYNPIWKFSADGNFFASAMNYPKIQGLRIWKISTCEKMNTISVSE